MCYTHKIDQPHTLSQPFHMFLVLLHSQKWVPATDRCSNGSCKVHLRIRTDGPTDTEHPIYEHPQVFFPKTGIVSYKALFRHENSNVMFCLIFKRFFARKLLHFYLFGLLFAKIQTYWKLTVSTNWRENSNSQTVLLLERFRKYIVDTSS